MKIFVVGFRRKFLMEEEESNASRDTFAGMIPSLDFP